jgi:hypothetical protein
MRPTWVCRLGPTCQGKSVARLRPSQCQVGGLLAEAALSRTTSAPLCSGCLRLLRDDDPHGHIEHQRRTCIRLTVPRSLSVAATLQHRWQAPCWQQCQTGGTSPARSPCGWRGPEHARNRLVLRDPDGREVAQGQRKLVAMRRPIISSSWAARRPPCCGTPQLNPVEGLWSSLKAVELANLTGPTLGRCSPRPTAASSESERPAPGLVSAAHRPVGLLIAANRCPRAARWWRNRRRPVQPSVRELSAITAPLPALVRHARGARDAGRCAGRARSPPRPTRGGRRVRPAL